MTNYEQAVALTSRMTLVERVLLLEHLSITLRSDIETEAYRHMPWEQFLELTYGSLANDPIERGEQPPYDVRDEIE